MQIIKDKQIVQDDWKYINDEDPLTNGNITVSLKRWQCDKASLLKHDGDVGLRISTDDSLDAIAGDLDKISLLEMNFKVFTDGRSFSQAWLLRNRYQFKGELRATGQFLRDQIYYLQRVGINSFKLENDDNLECALSALNDFTVNYQNQE